MKWRRSAIRLIIIFIVLIEFWQLFRRLLRRITWVTTQVGFWIWFSKHEYFLIVIFTSEFSLMQFTTGLSVYLFQLASGNRICNAEIIVYRDGLHYDLFSEKIFQLQSSVSGVLRRLETDKTLNHGGRFEWIDSTLVQCLKEGSWLLIDNVNFCRFYLLFYFFPSIDFLSCILKYDFWRYTRIHVVRHFLFWHEIRNFWHF